MNPPSFDPIPLLVIDDIWQDLTNPQHMIASVWVGGHPGRVVLDYSRRELIIAYVKIPSFLSAHNPSQQAVVRLMSEFEIGDRIELPVDLSESMRESLPAPIFVSKSAEHRVALDKEADQVQLDIETIHQTSSEPTRFEMTLRLDGVFMELDIELFNGPERHTAIRGRGLEKLSGIQSYALQRELLRRTMATPTSDPIPLLIIDDLWRSFANPQYVVAAVRVGGHSIRVMLNAEHEMAEVKHEEVPQLLTAHAPSHQAVVEVLRTFSAGEPMELPVDLSASLRHCSPPPLYLPMSAENQLMIENAADQVQLELSACHKTLSKPARFQLALTVDGLSMILDVALYAGPQRTNIMVRLGGDPLALLSDEQRYAIQRKLLQRL